MKLSVTYKIEDQRIQDLLCNAFEGGSNYWYEITKFNYPKDQTRKSLGIEFAHTELPFKGGSLTIKDCEGNDPKEYILDLKAIRRGIKVMAKKYPENFGDFISEDDDGNTGDIFLQCCLFGELIYG